LREVSVFGVKFLYKYIVLKIKKQAWHEGNFGYYFGSVAVTF